MHKVTLPEARNTAALLGPGIVVSLLIAAAMYAPAAHGTPLAEQLWWRICMAIFSALTAIAILGFVLPHVQGLRLRVPWRWVPTANHASIRANGWKDASIWERFEPTMPLEAGRSPAINAAKAGPVFSFEVGVGNDQEIEFEIPLRINLKGILRLAVGDEEQYAADVYIDTAGARVEAGYQTAEIAPHHFYIPRSVQGIAGFSAGFGHFSERPNDRAKSFRVFSVGVTHVNPTRGLVAFSVLC